MLQELLHTDLVTIDFWLDKQLEKYLKCVKLN
jgi:hypothetical protein